MFSFAIRRAYPHWQQIKSMPLARFALDHAALWAYVLFHGSGLVPFPPPERGTSGATRDGRARERLASHRQSSRASSEVLR